MVNNLTVAYLLIINTDNEVIAELDSDSHISLVSEEYFDRLTSLGPIEFLKEPPIKFKGMGSHLASKYSPIMLDVQIGRIKLKGRFIITDKLTSSPILLGSDFMIKNCVQTAPYSSGQWFCCIGPVDKPLGRVPTIITSKITLCNNNIECFEPFEIKKISVQVEDSMFNHDFEPNMKFCNNTCINSSLRDSPFKLVNETNCCTSNVYLQNMSPVQTTLLPGLNIVNAQINSSNYQIKNDLSLTQKEAEKTPDFEIELNPIEILSPTKPSHKTDDDNQE